MITDGMTLSKAVAESAAAVPRSDSLGMDQAAFRGFYQRTAPALRAYIARSLGIADLADDILQEAVYRFLRSSPLGLDEPQMKAYLYRTATSLVADYWRRWKREQGWSWKNLFSEQVPVRPELTDDMTRLFQLLKPQQRALLWLAYVEGFEHREIAAALGLQEKSVRVLLFRARNKLAVILRKEGFGPEATS